MRELEGRDELLDLSLPGSLMGLLERLVVRTEGVAGEPGLEGLALSDVDQITAAVYANLYGDAIECNPRCTSCGQDFTVAFSLQGLWRFVSEQSAEQGGDVMLEGPDERGIYTLADGSQFRLPNRADLAFAEGLEPNSAVAVVAERCVLSVVGTDASSIDRAMTLVGPRLDTDLDVSCAACQRPQTAGFNIEQFLTGALQRERTLILAEVHVLAKAYRWSRSEILAMSRSDRRAHVELVLAEAERGRPRS